MTTRIKIRNDIKGIHGLTPQNLFDLFPVCFKVWEPHADIKFELVDKHQHFTVRSAELYKYYKDGRHWHVRGRQSGSILYLHNGSISKHFSNRKENGVRVAHKWSPFSSVAAAGGILSHEWGHGVGFRHTNAENCVMHPTRFNLTLCKMEVEQIQKKYGKPKVKPDDEITYYDEYGKIRPGTKVRINIPKLNNGSVVLPNEERLFVANHSIVGYDLVIQDHKTNKTTKDFSPFVPV